MGDLAYRNIVILTGAGISAESGLGTFRDEDGLWTKFDLQDVATPEGFARNPDLVHDFYNTRRSGLLAAAPNQAHLALARLEAEYAGEVLVVTQNIDDLHERAGTTNLIHMHGELLKARCDGCGGVTLWRGDLGRDIACPHCAVLGGMRPHVVWFGEMPMDMGRIYSELARCDLFISIGTSGSVYPAAGFVEEVRRAGLTHTVEMNLEPSDGASHFSECILGPATEVIPAFVDRLLSSG